MQLKWGLGVFIDNAQELVKKPALSDTDLQRRFAITVKNAVASGFTSIHDAGFDPTSLDFFKRSASYISALDVILIIPQAS